MTEKGHTEGPVDLDQVSADSGHPRAVQPEMQRKVEEVLQRYGVASRYHTATNQWAISKGIAKPDRVCFLRSYKCVGCSKFVLGFLPSAGVEILNASAGLDNLQRMSRVVQCLQELEALDAKLVIPSTQEGSE
jgi:hypothetical protein